MLRRIALLLCVALLAAVPAATADASRVDASPVAAKKRKKKRKNKPPAQTPQLPSAPPGVKAHRFSVTFSEKRTTTWSYPDFMDQSTCAQEFWSSGKGDERVELKTRRPVAALVYKTGSPFMPLALVWGSWNFTTPSASTPMGGLIQRHARFRKWTLPGQCGGPKTEEPNPSNDCGDRLLALSILLTMGNDRRLGVQIGGDPTYSQADRDKMEFHNCQVLRPRKDRNEWNPDRIKVDPAAFTNPRQPTITFSHSAKFSDTSSPEGRPHATKSTVEWKIVFTRVR